MSHDIMADHAHAIVPAADVSGAVPFQHVELSSMRKVSFHFILPSYLSAVIIITKVGIISRL